MSNVGLLLTKYLYRRMKMEGNIARYFKYRKINKYLKSKNSSQYNCLDNLLVYYVNGKLQKLLESYNFRDINIYALIGGKRGNYLQIECSFYNLTVDIGFDEDCFDYTIYFRGYRRKASRKPQS